jgi:hypothetical protein
MPMLTAVTILEIALSTYLSFTPARQRVTTSMAR